MPTVAQGDIFLTAERVALTIVIGHLGFNQMHERWVAFRKGRSSALQVSDPFTELAGQAIEWSPGRWLWFVHDTENRGMTDALLEEALDAAFSWASRNGIASIATNGVANIDHGQDAADNRLSDHARATWLIDLATRAERAHRLSIELVSLSDVFVRQSAGTGGTSEAS